MPYGYGSVRSSRVWQSWDVDNHGEVSSLVMRAYAVSLLLLASVLVWTVGDAWMHYDSPSLLDSNGYSNFTVLDFARGSNTNGINLPMGSRDSWIHVKLLCACNGDCEYLRTSCNHARYNPNFPVTIQGEYISIIVMFLLRDYLKILRRI